MMEYLCERHHPRLVLVFLQERQTPLPQRLQPAGSKRPVAVERAARDLASWLEVKEHEDLPVLHRLHLLDQFLRYQALCDPRDGVLLEVCLVLQPLAPLALVPGLLYGLVHKHVLPVQPSELCGHVRVVCLVQQLPAPHLRHIDAALVEQRLCRADDDRGVRPVARLHQVLLRDPLRVALDEPVEELDISGTRAHHLQVHRRSQAPRPASLTLALPCRGGGEGALEAP
mmetsp:Transcript_68792/g.180325  ORF Transcript_68792/g.180325 Transcript_68792/m.180325 type:complete len:228 (+) Transcript_68792:394-1077(+)